MAAKNSPVGGGTSVKFNDNIIMPCSFPESERIESRGHVLPKQ